MFWQAPPDLLIRTAAARPAIAIACSVSLALGCALATRPFHPMPPPDQASLPSVVVYMAMVYMAVVSVHPAAVSRRPPMVTVFLAVLSCRPTAVVFLAVLGCPRPAGKGRTASAVLD